MSELQLAPVSEALKVEPLTAALSKMACRRRRLVVELADRHGGAGEGRYERLKAFYAASRSCSSWL